MTEHPIKPPPELVQQWRARAAFGQNPYADHLATLAAQWGADQELEACCEWISKQAFGDRQTWTWMSAQLRAARRPKPPSLREQALAKTKELLDDPGRALLIEVRETLELNRRALEALPDD